MKNRDQFGGCTDIRFDATGFFRLEKTDQRWWLVTPEGHAFLSFGVNHVTPNLLTAPYNRAFWAGRFGIDPDSDRAAFLPHMESKVRADLSAMGLNTLGCHSPTRFYSSSVAPYVPQYRCVDICHYMTPSAEDFLDVFSEGFVERCEQQAHQVALPRKDDPFLLGYSFRDCPVLTDLEALPRDNTVYGRARIGLPTWPRVMRNLGPDKPGKRAYVELMRELYRDRIKEFNWTYGTDFETFDELGRTANWRSVADRSNSRETRDNEAFLFRIVDKCFEVEVATLRKVDPNHLIFGDKFNGNTDVPDEIIKLHAKHFDLIFYQFYATWFDQELLLDRFARLSGGRPILHGDSCYTTPKENMPDPYGPQCVSQEIRVEYFRESMYNALARDDFVGWCWCGWMDRWESQEPGKQHSGFQDPFGAFDRLLAQAMKEFSDKMYDVARGIHGPS